MRLVSFLQKIHESVLLEARIDFLRQKYAETLQAYALNKGEAPAGQDVFGMLTAADPTKNKQFLQWLIKIYLQGNLRLEDAYKAQEYLTLFSKAKAKLDPQARDINRYGSLQDLFKVVQIFKEQPVELESGKAQARAYDRKMHSEDHAQVLYNDDELKVVIPKTAEASCHFGKNTEWCTAATTAHNYFQDYAQQGPLFIILLKKENQRYQFHFEAEGGMFMDENDEEINIYELVKKVPKLLQVPVLGEKLKMLDIQRQAHDFAAKKGFTPELKAAIDDFLHKNKMEGAYSEGFGGYVLENFSNVEDFIDDYQSSGVAQTVWNKMSGGEDLDYDYHYESVTGDDIMALFVDLAEKHPDTYMSIVDYATEKYGREHEMDRETMEYTHNLLSVLKEEKDFLISEAKSAVADGYRYGAEADMAKDFNTYLRNLESEEYGLGLELDFDNYDGPAHLVISPENMAWIVQASIRREDELEGERWLALLDIKDMEEPYGGWSGYDEDGALESFINMIPDVL